MIVPTDKDYTDTKRILKREGDESNIPKIEGLDIYRV